MWEKLTPLTYTVTRLDGSEVRSAVCRLPFVPPAPYPEYRGNGQNYIRGEKGRFAGSRPAGGSGSGVDKSGRSGIMSIGRNVDTDGLRNEAPLTAEQIDRCTEYVKKLGFTEDISYSEYSNTAFVGSVEGERYCRLVIGTDVFPNPNAKTVNGRLSYKAALAHEIVGHYEAWKVGFELNITALDEAQASIRAARFADGLSPAERISLFRDALTRLHNADISLKEARKSIRINER